MGSVSRFTAVLALLVLLDSALVALVTGNTANVNIANQVGGPIRLHCKSSTQDLGEQTLADGQHFEWNFNAFVGGVTLYSCDFAWGPKTQSLVVYENGGGKVGCGHCVWIVRPNGFYVTENGIPPFTFVAPWN